MVSQVLIGYLGGTLGIRDRVAVRDKLLRVPRAIRRTVDVVRPKMAVFSGSIAARDAPARSGYMEDDSSLLPNCWTAIAERPRVLNGKQALEWRALPNAPLRISDAHLLFASDLILMANRHFDDRVELVVRPAVSHGPDLTQHPEHLIPNVVGAKRRKTSAPL